MTPLEMQLHASIALPKLIEACEGLLKLAREEHETLAINALLLGGHTQESADVWFEAIIKAELALKAAEPLEEIVGLRRKTVARIEGRGRLELVAK